MGGQGKGRMKEDGVPLDAGVVVCPPRNGFALPYLLDCLPLAARLWRMS